MTSIISRYSFDHQPVTDPTISTLYLMTAHIQSLTASVSNWSPTPLQVPIFSYLDTYYSVHQLVTDPTIGTPFLTTSLISKYVQLRSTTGHRTYNRYPFSHDFSHIQIRTTPVDNRSPNLQQVPIFSRLLSYPDTYNSGRQPVTEPTTGTHFLMTSLISRYVQLRSTTGHRTYNKYPVSQCFSYIQIRTTPVSNRSPTLVSLCILSIIQPTVVSYRRNLALLPTTSLSGGKSQLHI